MSLGRRPEEAARPWVKVCGVTRAEDARTALALGVDLVGLNFYPRSPRALDLGSATAVAEALAGRTVTVGVFVDADEATVRHHVEVLGLDMVQFHGREAPEMVGRFGDRAIRAYRVGPGFRPDDVLADEDVWGFLFDRYEPGVAGGTGKSWSFEKIGRLPSGKPSLVAGGIAPGVARAALRRSGAAGVDVCSGVESAPGVKDARRLEQLIREVKDG